MNLQQKEDYRVHLETKTTAQAKLTLRNFYSNNKEVSSKLRTKTDSLGNESLAQKGKRADSDEFSASNSPVNFFLNSVTLEKIVGQYGFDYKDPEFAFLNDYVIDGETFAEPAAKCQRISANFFSRPVMQEETTNQHRLNCGPLGMVDVTPTNNTVPGETESSTVSGSSASAEYTSPGSELTFQDISSEPENQSFDELISWVNGEQSSGSFQFSMLEKFDRLGQLGEIYIGQPVVKFRYILPQ